MERNILFLLAWAITTIKFFTCITSLKHHDTQVYIICLRPHPRTGDVSQLSLHLNLLEKVIASRANESIVYSYKSFDAFAAKLTVNEMQRVSGLDGVAFVFRSKTRKIHTTRSWDFVGFPQNVPRTDVESDVIIGIIDTGIWPESDSFKDEGFGPPPSRWKGVCQGYNFTCNNKIIGARYYLKKENFSETEIASPRDSSGHGTHTASTAAGGIVPSANMLGFGLGTARGGVPSARIAVYKVCWPRCTDEAILAAFSDAIADGVDLISISLGGDFAEDYLKDSIAIGSFHAFQHGILTSSPAGNDGPYPKTVSSVSPWALSVAASTIGRRFVTNVELGNHMVYQGVSINTFDQNKVMYPLIYAGDAPNKTAGSNSSMSRYCIPDYPLDRELVEGKIVLCDKSGAVTAAFSAGAVGTVIQGTAAHDDAFAYPLPTSRFDENSGLNISIYVNSTSNPTATILRSTEMSNTSTPYVASFSSRGPNRITKEILKPDLAAPGVHILAAWSPVAPPSDVQGDPRSLQFNIISGTSMSCPHATAAAAYVKSFHPSWSPAAIKSALMTTAHPMNSSINPEAELAYGAGNINPINAANPGLIYDSTTADYVEFLCGQGYATSAIQHFTEDNSTCSTNKTVRDLNLPSFAVSTPPAQQFTTNFTRTVTNVGSPTSIYIALVTAPREISITVQPRILQFTSLGQKLSFVLTVTGVINNGIESASLVWHDGVHLVRSPMAFFISK